MEPDAAQGNPNQRRYTVNTAGDRVVDVVLGTPAIGEIRKQATLHICEWPRLQIKWEEFDSLQVLNDGAKHIDVGFDRRWEEGRPDPKAGIQAGKNTNQVQSPLCWAAGATIRVRAGFRVTRKSTDDETVSIEGRATIDGVKAGSDAADGGPPIYLYHAGSRPRRQRDCRPAAGSPMLSVSNGS